MMWGDIKMYQDERKLDFKPLGKAIKKAREEKGWTQEYLAQLVDLTPRSIMYIENKGQHPSLKKFFYYDGNAKSKIIIVKLKGMD